MSKETVLAKVDEDLRRDNLGTARDRLHSLVRAYPDDLSLRARLAEIYDRMHFPAMAGRYWYFEERRTPNVEAAIRAFERSCNNNPLLMLSALKFRGDVVKMPEHARGRLEALRREVHNMRGFLPKPDVSSAMLRGRRAEMPYEVREARQRASRMLYYQRRRWMRTHRLQSALREGLVPIGRHDIDARVVFGAPVLAVLSIVGLVTIGMWVWRAVA
jgi:hypothetical protein